MSSLLTADFQFEVRDLLIGAGTDFELLDVDGLGSADVRSGDVERGGAHGLHAQEDLYGGRTVTITVEVWGATAAAVQTNLDSLKEAWKVSSSDASLYWQQPGSSQRLMYGRTRRIRVPSIRQANLGFVSRVVCEFVATDPRLYAVSESSQDMALGSSSGGLTFPVTFPLTFGAGGTSGIYTLTNSGTFETWPTVRFDGPLTNPRLEHIGRGETFEYTGTVGSGDWVEVDFRERTVLLNGTSSRYSNVLGSDWWTVDPGDNEVRFAAGSGSGTASVTWRSAWL